MSGDGDQGSYFSVKCADLRPCEVSDRMTRRLGEIQDWLTDKTGSLIINFRFTVLTLQNISIRLNVRHMSSPFFCLHGRQPRRGHALEYTLLSIGGQVNVAKRMPQTNREKTDTTKRLFYGSLRSTQESAEG